MQRVLISWTKFVYTSERDDVVCGVIQKFKDTKILWVFYKIFVLHMIMCILHDISDNVHGFWCRLDFTLHMFLDNIHNFMCRFDLDA